MINIRDWLSLKTAITLTKKINDDEFLSSVLNKRMKRENNLLKRSDIISVFEYVFKAIYGEISKIIIIYTIAYFLNIFMPTLIISLIFATLRMFAGGVHMDTYLKCLISTSIIFLLSASSVSKIHTLFILNIPMLIVIVVITYIISIILAKLYAPRDVITKPIKEKDKSLYRKKTINYLTVISVIMMTLIITFSNAQLVILSICTGLLVEMLTITPVADKLFNAIRGEK